MRIRPRLLPVALIGAAALVLLLVPAHVDLPIAWLSASHLLGHAADGGMPLWWLLEDVANVAMFVPVGWALARVLPAAAALGAGTGLSAACELAQRFIPHRDGSLLDLAMNAIGTLVGVVVAVALRRRQAMRALPQAVQRQYGAAAPPASSIGMRQPSQFGAPREASAASSLEPVPTGTW